MKKTKDYLGKSDWQTFKKLLLIMKLFVILVLLTCLEAHAVIKSQTVTLNVNDVSVKEVLKEINKQTGYSFFFSDELLTKAGKLSLNIKDAPIDEVLKICFRNLPISYKIIESTIVLQSSGEDDQNSASQQDLIRISGNITDSKGAPVVGLTHMVNSSSSVCAETRTSAG